MADRQGHHHRFARSVDRDPKQRSPRLGADGYCRNLDIGRHDATVYRRLARRRPGANNTAMSTNPKKAARTDHPILPVLAERYSPYAFEPRPVEPDKLRSCLEAARWAASSYNEQPWRCILATRDDDEAWQTMLSCLVEANREWAQQAGALIITATRRAFSRNDKPNRVCEHDVGLAAANLTVQAQSLGLHVHQMAGIDQDACRRVYDIPEGFDPLTAIAIGYAATPDQIDDEKLLERETAPRSRMPLSEWVFAGRFGQAAGLVR
jgi:nitroreductase